MGSFAGAVLRISNSKRYVPRPLPLTLSLIGGGRGGWMDKLEGGSYDLVFFPLRSGVRLMERDCLFMLRLFRFFSCWLAHWFVIWTDRLTI